MRPWSPAGRDAGYVDDLAGTQPSVIIHDVGASGIAARAKATRQSDGTCVRQGAARLSKAQALRLGRDFSLSHHLIVAFQTKSVNFTFIL